MILIPISSRDRAEDFGDPFFRVSITIDGIPYILDLRWNNTTLAWYLDIFDGDEIAIGVGNKLMLGTLINGRNTNSRGPDGFFFLSDSSGQDIDADFQALGDRVRLYFIGTNEVSDIEDELIVPNIPAVNLRLAPVDGPGLVYVPQIPAHWTALGITPPTTQANTQIASGDLDDLTGGGVDMLQIGAGHVFQNLITGWETYFTVQKPAGQTGSWEYQGDLDVLAGESYAFLIYGSWSSVVALPGAFFTFWDIGANNQLDMSYDSSDDVTFEIDGLTVAVESPPDETTIRPFLVMRAATFTGSPTETYVTTLFGTDVLATGSGIAASGDSQTRGSSSAECNYGPVLAFWDSTAAESLYNEGNFDRTLLETLRWKLQF